MNSRLFNIELRYSFQDASLKLGFMAKGEAETKIGIGQKRLDFWQVS